MDSVTIYWQGKRLDASDATASLTIDPVFIERPTSRAQLMEFPAPLPDSARVNFSVSGALVAYCDESVPKRKPAKRGWWRRLWQ